MYIAKEETVDIEVLVDDFVAFYIAGKVPKWPVQGKSITESAW